MFITNEANRSAFSSLCGESGGNYWRAVELGLHTPWFVVTLIHHPSGEEEGDGVSYSRTLFLSNVNDAIELAKAAETSCEVQSVQVVTPGHINHSRDWKMEPLRTVWTAVEPTDEDVVVEILETISGVTHYQSHFATPLKKLRDRKIKFQFTCEAAEQS